MKYLLDTNICIGLMKGERKIAKAIRNKSPDEIVLCSVVKAELLYGIKKSQKRTQNERLFETLTREFSSLPFTDETAEHYALIRATLEQKGKPVGAYDLMIAAIALQHNLIVVTRNLREFERIPSLSIEEW